MTCDTVAFIVAFDYSKDERQLTYVRRERERENVKEVSADLPEQYLGGKC